MTDELLDAAKRIADTYMLHRIADPIGNLGQFFAARLSDGTTNNNMYPSMAAARADLSRHDDENRWMYIQIVPSNLSVRDASILLATNRKLHDAGFRVSDTDGRTMIPRIGREDHMAQLRSVFKGTPPRNVRYG